MLRTFKNLKIKNIENFQKTYCNIKRLCYNKATKEKEVQSNEIVIDKKFVKTQKLEV